MLRLGVSGCVPPVHRCDSLNFQRSFGLRSFLWSKRSFENGELDNNQRCHGRPVGENGRRKEIKRKTDVGKGTTKKEIDKEREERKRERERREREREREREKEGWGVKRNKKRKTVV